ncbi:DUF4282 domain-containing protein [Blastopirellula marina]|uniref:GYF domain-containing protein n=1 Tax=Blastopirellula marina TaxID=124 RepID=A0A2S8G6W9_9BACT|nr:DUF4282 domain-containing protein [Blastopirellula marina]PQO40163.1 hypothetical protein C5Y98_06040 [Blastopirellula marina]PTL45530.1 DUF4282 domain-containing protein [Blastopirellula marina]
MAEEFYLKANENAPETGPFSSKKMRQLAAAGQITPETLVRRGDSSWVHASSVRGLELPTGPAPLTPPPAPPAGEVPMGIPVTPGDEVKSAIPTSTADEGGISLGPRLPDPTGSTGEAQVQPRIEEPRAFDEAAPTPPSITAPPPPPPAPEAPVVAIEPKEVEPEISEMISVAPADKSAAKGKKKKGKAKAPRAASSGSSSGGGIGGLFSFNTMIAPSVAKVVYFLGLALILLIWLGSCAATLVFGLIGGELISGVIGAGVTFVVGGIVALLYILGLRISVEVVIAFFRAADDLAAIRANQEEKEKV